MSARRKDSVDYMPFMEQIRSFTWPFWIANMMEMFERFAYYGVRIVIPIYIASSEDPMGLHFTHIQKGSIFAWWALVQSLVPMFSGGFADRYGYKKTIATSITIKIAGYLLMATQRQFYPFLFGCLMLALGTAIFKPGVQGTLLQGLNRKNSSLGWGIFYLLVNIGGFLGPPFAGILHAMSWPSVFYGCAAIVSINYLSLLTYKEVHSGGKNDETPWDIIKVTFREIRKLRLVIFILIMSGLWLMLNQMWDMLPNFIEDWVDSSSLVAFFGFKSAAFVHHTPRGMQVNQEWMINLNSLAIIFFMIPIATLTGLVRRLTSIVIGTALASLGLMLSGYTSYGLMCILGIILFSFGEMSSSPKMNEYLGVIAPPGKKGLYMGYANIPLAIGWFYGSFMGGRIYDTQGDKAVLALRYLHEHAGMTVDAVSKIARTQAMTTLQGALHQSNGEVTRLLWQTYHPWQLWIPFTMIGVASAIGMAFYSHFAKRWTDSNA